MATCARATPPAVQDACQSRPQHGPMFKGASAEAAPNWWRTEARLVASELVEPLPAPSARRDLPTAIRRSSPRPAPRPAQGPMAALAPRDAADAGLHGRPRMALSSASREHAQRRLEGVLQALDRALGPPPGGVAGPQAGASAGLAAPARRP